MTVCVSEFSEWIIFHKYPLDIIVQESNHSNSSPNLNLATRSLEVYVLFSFPLLQSNLYIYVSYQDVSHCKGIISVFSVKFYTLPLVMIGPQG